MTGKQKSARRQLFPEKLLDLVNKPDSGVQWSPDGKRIEVERTQLEKFIGTKFRSHNFDSFIRQLHFYGFRKCGNSYHHDKFQRGQPGALLGMKRKYSTQSHTKSMSDEIKRDDEYSNSASSSNQITLYTLQSISALDTSGESTGSSPIPCFGNIREDIANANSENNSLKITIPELMKETGSTAWPKTLVFQNCWNGTQNILSAYFIYRTNESH